MNLMDNRAKREKNTESFSSMGNWSSFNWYQKKKKKKKKCS